MVKLTDAIFYNLINMLISCHGHGGGEIVNRLRTRHVVYYSI